MINKEGWDRTKERFRAFWEGELIDRCCMAVTAPVKKPMHAEYKYREPKDDAQRWLDIDYRMEQAMYYFSNTYFGGDAFPFYWNNLGPGVAASFMGSGYRCAENTVWFDGAPPITDWESRRKIGLDIESDMWKIAWNMTESFCKAAGDDFHVGITDLGGNLDIAVSLRGNDALLFDLYDHPEEVKKLVDEIDAAWFQAYDRLQSLISSHIEGTSAWMGLWSDKRWYPLQCDFSAMISAEMFDEFVKPYLEKEAAFFDYAVYHLDGPGQIRHLESILEIDSVIGIQCVPGETLSERTGEFHNTFYSKVWLPVYRRIQEKGKRLLLTGVHPAELDDLMGYLSPEGLFISTYCKSQEQAEEIERKFERFH